MKHLLPLFAVLLCLAGVSSIRAVDYEKNLAQVPATDPETSGTVKLIDPAKGHHPRLLFTREEMAERKKRVADDPLLKKMYDDLSAGSKRFKFTAPAGKPDIVLNDTAALSVSFDRYAGLAVAYTLDHEPGEKDAIVGILQMMLAQPYWTDADELDSNMGAGNNLFMAALLYDAVYDDIDPAFRLEMGKKLLTHARRLYYLGFLEKGTNPIKYWQQDPQNNHRWHRTAGLTAALLAVADLPELDSRWMLERLKDQTDFLMKWVPPDGDCHEGSGYQTFGFIYLLFAAEMMDRNVGTHYLEHPAFRNAWAQQLYYRAPGRQGDMSFGDDSNTRAGVFGAREAAFLRSAVLTHDKNVKAAMIHLLQARTATTDPKRPYVFPWTTFLCYDPSAGGGDYKAVPTCRLFADLGAASMRDSWEDDAVCFTFKCGPVGGYKLSDYAAANPKDGAPHYVNVAHDDPDANSFALGAGGEFYFHPGNYTERRKLTFYSNSVLVDGKGQVTEGEGWLQPVPGVDMRTLSYLTGWKSDPATGRVIVEGEAGAAYQGLTAPELRQTRKDAGRGGPAPTVPQPDVPVHPTAALKHFRRTAVWLPHDYILVLDDVQADKAARVAWRGIPYKGICENAAEGLCSSRTQDGSKRMDFQILSNRPLDGSFDYMLMDGRWGNEMVNQCEFAAQGDAVKFACLLDPWKRGSRLALTESGGVVTLTVKTGGSTDTWTWKPARDAKTPSVITGSRDGKPLFGLSEDDRPPQE